jgi:hypothetical protein
MNTRPPQERLDLHSSNSATLYSGKLLNFPATWRNYIADKVPMFGDSPVTLWLQGE